MTDSEWQAHVRGKEPTIILAGAAHGLGVMRYRLTWPLASFVLFEPNPAYHRQLARFDDDGLVTVVPHALSDKREPATFYKNQAPQTSSLYLGTEEGGRRWGITPTQSIEVECETLDGYCTDNRIWQVGFLELDAQGAELKALHGARELLSRKAIDVLMVEVFWTQVYQGIPLAWEVNDFMHGMGYIVAGEQVENWLGGTKHWSDLIYIRGQA